MNAAPNWKPAPALRSPEWLSYVRSLPSVESGQMGCVAHHAIGGRYSTLKTSDYFAIPLTDAEHKRLHDWGWAEWESKHGNQMAHAEAVMKRAIEAGVLVWKPDANLMHWADTAQEIERAIQEGQLVFDKRAAKFIAG